MALIFDQFPTREAADVFANHVKSTYNRKASVYDSQKAASGNVKSAQELFNLQSQNDDNVYDVFPWQLTAPIVLVERLDDVSQEELIEEDAEKFSGVFAGT